MIKSLFFLNLLITQSTLMLSTIGYFIKCNLWSFISIEDWSLVITWVETNINQEILFIKITLSAIRLIADFNVLTVPPSRDVSKKHSHCNKYLLKKKKKMFDFDYYYWFILFIIIFIIMFFHNIIL